MRTLISAQELAAALDARRDIRVLDVRWKLGGPPGRPSYLAGHIPGAAFADLDTELAGHGAPSDGRHPLPSLATLQAAARRWGLNDGDAVVVYDEEGNLSAARAWWLLRYGGLADVLLLDGALPAWLAAGLPLRAEAEPTAPGTVTLSYGHLPTLDADAAGALARTGTLLDARAAERFRGDTEPIDPRAGHIPGAVSAPAGENLDAAGRFLPAAALRARFEALGARSAPAADAAAPPAPDAAPVAAPAAPGAVDASDASDASEPPVVGAYCGSGVTAAHEAVALTIAGFIPALYPGSWSQWSNLPGRPVETGDPRATSGG